MPEMFWKPNKFFKTSKVFKGLKVFGASKVSETLTFFKTLKDFKTEDFWSFKSFRHPWRIGRTTEGWILQKLWKVKTMFQ